MIITPTIEQLCEENNNRAIEECKRLIAHHINEVSKLERIVNNLISPPSDSARDALLRRNQNGQRE